MEQAEHCMVCGQTLGYHQQVVEAVCQICGAAGATPILCPDGHYVCDHCHGAKTLDRLPKLLALSRFAAPEDILEQLLTLPGLPMHGPEHHALVALALLRSAALQGLPLPAGWVAEALRRGSQIPGGACGYLGTCGAGVGLGIAVSLACGATPLKGRERALANRATAVGLLATGDGEARCCKRMLRVALRQGRIFFRDELGIVLPERQTGPCCREMARNKECPGIVCGYFLSGPGVGG